MVTRPTLRVRGRTAVHLVAPSFVEGAAFVTACGLPAVRMGGTRDVVTCTRCAAYCTRRLSLRDEEARAVGALAVGGEIEIVRPVRDQRVHFIGGDSQQNDPSCWGWFFDGKDQHGYMVLARGLNETHDHGLVSIPSPLGAPGDVLVCRESWARIVTRDDCDDGRLDDGAECPCLVTEYRADAHTRYPGAWDDDQGDDPECPRWRSAATMPARFARRHLEVLAVSVERDGDGWRWRARCRRCA